MPRVPSYRLKEVERQYMNYPVLNIVIIGNIKSNILDSVSIQINFMI